MVAIPPNYDPMKPYPLGFAFHGYNLNEKTCYQGSECPGFRTVVGAKAITVFPKSIGPGWEYPVNLLAPNIQFVKDIIAQMKTEYCIDESRVFVSGVSSGGQMTHHMRSACTASPAASAGHWLRRCLCRSRWRSAGASRSRAPACSCWSCWWCWC